jgi:hypothetical protein
LFHKNENPASGGLTGLANRDRRRLFLGKQLV